MIRSRLAFATAALAACAAPAAHATNVQLGLPYALVATGFQAVAVSATVVTITPPPGSGICYVQTQVQGVRYRPDGVDPTAGVGGGMILAVGALPLALTRPGAGVRFVAQTGTATLDVDCEK